MSNTKQATQQTVELTAKEKFNAYSNATHIFAFKEEGTQFKILDYVDNGDSLKAVVLTEAGEVKGLYTDSITGANAIKEVYNVFGDEQPFVVVNLKKTPKGASVYYIEVV